MGLTFIASTGGYADGSGTNLAAASALTLADGDIVVMLAGWYNSDVQVTDMSDGGSNTLTAFTRGAQGTSYEVLGYLLDASAGSATFEYTLDGAATYRGMVVMQFRPDNGETVSLVDGPSKGQGFSSAIATGTIDTAGAGDDLLVVAGASLYDEFTADSGQIAGGAATTIEPAGSYADIAAWYRVFTSNPGDGINGTAAIGNDANWVADILAIKSVAGGAAYTLTADKGNLTLTGQAANLVAARKMTADYGSLALSGQEAAFVYGHPLTAEFGGLQIIGQEATLTYTPNEAAYTLTAEAGSLVLTGVASDLLRGLLLQADAGSLVLGGYAASLLKGFLLQAGYGDLVSSGQDADLLRGLRLASEAGLLELSGMSANLVYSGSTGRRGYRRYIRRAIGGM